MRLRLAAPAALVASLALAGCGTGGLTAQGDAGNGKTLFQQKCGACHILADAGTQGRSGPNLDDAFAGMRSEDEEQHFDESTIREVIEDQIYFAAPPMPQNLVTGQDAADVATYVAQVAGVNGYTEAAGGDAGANGEGGPGKSLFAANCASCHTLAAADATGQVGPNLDEAKPDEESVRQKVIAGGGGMPSFEGQLSDEEITQIAQFVAQAAGSAAGGGDGDTPTSSDTNATPGTTTRTTTRGGDDGGGQGRNRGRNRGRGGGTSGNSGSGNSGSG